jgi:NADPH:quinone reductase-like Zn-dependent oxidoreductase
VSTDPVVTSNSLEDFANSFLEELTKVGYKQAKTNSARNIKIVFDNSDNPLLTRISPEHFSHLTNLLRQPSRIFWVTVSSCGSNYGHIGKFAINGLSRSAQSENDLLQLITVDLNLRDFQDHAEMLQKLTWSFQNSFSNQTETHREREYYYKDGTVLIPRVMPSEVINEWVVNYHLIEDYGFTTSEEKLQLLIPKVSDSSKLCFSDSNMDIHPLTEDEVLIAVEACALSFSKLKASLHECAGTIIQTGTKAHHLEVGERVFALTKDICSNKVRVPDRLVYRVPGQTLFEDIVAFPLDFMSSIYVIHYLVHLQRGSKILIQTSKMNTNLTLSTVTLAQTLECEIFIILDSDSNDDLRNGLNNGDKIEFISQTIITNEWSLKVKYGTIRFDVVLNYSEQAISPIIVPFLDKFSHIVTFDQSKTDDIMIATTPSQIDNVTIHKCRFDSVLESRPEMTAILFKRALETILQDLPTDRLRIPKVIKLEDACYDARITTDLTEGLDFRTIILKASENTLVPTKTQPNLKHSSVEESGSYLIAGGLGDIGRLLLKLLARQGAKHLIILSRRDLSAERLSEIEYEVFQESTDCHLHYFKCNISSIDDLSNVAAELEVRQIPAIKGIIQAAVQLQDITLEYMGLEEFNIPLQTKLYGTANLRQIFGFCKLDFFITLSSAVSIIGSSGQANYNAGNCTQDGLAFAEKNSDCHYMSLNLGYIEETGAITGNDTRINALRRQGLVGVKLDELEKFLLYALSTKARSLKPIQAIIGFDTVSISNSVRNATATSPLLVHCYDQFQQDICSTGKSSSNSKKIQDVAADDVVTHITEAITIKLSSVVSLTNKQLDVERSMLDYGIDSLTAIELRSWIMQNFQASL